MLSWQAPHFRVVVLTGMCLLMLLPSFAPQNQIRNREGASIMGIQSTGYVASQAQIRDPGGGVLVANVTVGRDPAGVAYDDSNRYVYVTNDLSNNTSVISGTNVVGTIPVGIGPLGISYDSRNQYVYVANALSPSNSVSVINGTTVVATIPIVGDWDTAYDSSNGYVYVTRPSYDGLSVINGTTIIANITAGIGTDSFPQGVTFDSGNGYIYVSDYGSDTVNVISGTEVIANVTAGSNPEGLCYDGGNGYIYVANGATESGSGPGNVSVINGTTLVATIPVEHPSGVAYASSNGYVYVIGGYTSTYTLTVVNDTTVIDTILVGPPSWGGIGYDSANRDIYMTASPNIVNVISTTTDYSLTNNGPVSITAGGTGNVTITTTLTSSTLRPVTLSCASLPPGIDCRTFSVNPVTPTISGAASILGINVTSSVAAGLYSFQVSCAPLGTTTTPTNVTVIVKAANLILGLEPTIVYTIVAVVVAAVVAVSVIVYQTIRRGRREAATPHTR